MTTIRKTRSRRRGLSLIEVTVSTGLIVMLSMLLSNAWIWLGRPLMQTAARCTIAQEADMALECLARDLGGCLPETSAGVIMADQFVGWNFASGGELILCYDSDVNPNGIADWAAPDTVVMYELAGNSLLRTNQSSGAAYTAAQYVQGFTVNEAAGDAQITIDFLCRGVSLSYTIIAKNPL